MTQQHVLYGIRVAGRERDRDGDRLWRPVSRLGPLPFSSGGVGTHLTWRPFQTTDRCANDLGRG
jgi:hypothetical protein